MANVFLNGADRDIETAIMLEQQRYWNSYYVRASNSIRHR